MTPPSVAASSDASCTTLAGSTNTDVAATVIKGLERFGQDTRQANQSQPGLSTGELSTGRWSGASSDGNGELVAFGAAVELSSGLWWKS